MKILLHRNFKKQYKKLRAGEKRKFKERRDLFLVNPFHPILNNHELHGEYRMYRSINITGDLRVHYELLKKGLVLFITIGKHPDLYGR
jgi:addiction module RelE/StbE family toxin